MKNWPNANCGIIATLAASIAGAPCRPIARLTCLAHTRRVPGCSSSPKGSTRRARSIASIAATNTTGISTAL